MSSTTNSASARRFKVSRCIIGQPVAMRLLAGGFSVVLLAVLAGCPQGPSNEMPMVTGARVPLTSAVVNQSGGTVTVNDPGTPLDGLSVEIPVGAYPSATNVSLSYQQITSHRLREGFTPASPLVEIDTGGKYADQIMIATIPADIPDGYFGMPFYYDTATGRMEAVPVVAQDTNSVTLATNHFCHIVVTRIPLSDLQNRQIETLFQPGEDDWQVENYGSYISPIGNCHGLSISAIWYFVEKHMKGEAQLNSLYDSHTLPAGMSTPNFSLDDDVATRLVSVIQKDIKGNDYQEVVDRFDTEGAVLSRDELHFYATVAAILYTGEPQELGFYSHAEGVGHAAVCYKVDGDTLYVADPNFIGSDFPYVALTNRRFDAYLSAETLTNVIAGEYTAYDQISFTGQTSLYRWDLLGPLWTDMESDTIGQDKFPGYTLRVTERDPMGTITDEYELDLLNDHHTTHPTLEVSVNANFESKLVAYRYVEGAAPTKLSTTLVPLNPGTNHVGYLILGKPTTENPEKAWFWVGFEWVTVIYSADLPQVQILEPEEGATFAPEDSVAFRGVATDASGNTLTDAALAWTSDIDGDLGSGEAIQTSLSTGSHMITLTATDAAGKQGQAHVSVVVTEEPTEDAQMRLLYQSQAISQGGTHTINAAVTVGSETVVEFTIRNEGVGNLAIHGIQITGSHAGDFALTAPPSPTVLPGASTNIQITFTPSVAGARSAMVTIASNDADQQGFTFTIVGTGQASGPLCESECSGECPIPANAEVWESTYMDGTLHAGYSTPDVWSVGPQCVWTNQTRSVLTHQACRDETGEFHGLSCTWWSTTGQPMFRIDYNHGRLGGVYLEYFESGQTKRSSNYVDGELNGEDWYYYEDGTHQREAHYLMGIYDGDLRMWYRSGQMELETHFDNGVENGRRREWYEDGRLKMDCDIVQGEWVFCRV